MTVQSLRQSYLLDVRLTQLPSIWRQLRVRSDILLGELHTALQLCFGWADQHLHYFAVSGKRYGIPEPEGADDEHKVHSQERIRLDQLLTRAGEAMDYVYDFGDHWEHRVELVAIEAFSAADRVPRCLDGALAGPPEDCGGPAGYQHLLAVLKNPKHREHREMLAWLGGYYFPDLFDLEETNERLTLHSRPRSRT